MVRSANIGKTDQLVWNMVKSVLQQIQDLSPGESIEASSDHQLLHDPDRFGAAGFACLSPEQADRLSDEEKRVIVLSLITRASVFFDAKTKKHRVDVEFDEKVSRMLAPAADHQYNKDYAGEHADGQSVTFAGSDVRKLLGDAGKKFEGSGANFAADLNYSVTVE